MLSTSPLAGCCLVGRVLLPALIFNLASAVPGSWPSQCTDNAVLLMFPFSEASVSALVPPLAVSTPRFVPARLSPGRVSMTGLCAAASALSVSHLDHRALTVNQHSVHVVQDVLPCSLVCWGLHGGVTILALVVVTRHLGSSPLVFCDSKGDVSTACLRVCFQGLP